jgi:hypothetical protein
MNMHQESATPALPKVYIETSVISYMTARPSAEPITLARQQSSLLLWGIQHQFAFYVSETVVEEISGGDPSAAHLRRACISNLPRLPRTPSADALIETLIQSKAVPSTSYLDAVHIAIAAVHEMDYIVSWNFKHIAGLHARNRITDKLRQLGYNKVTIHTPDEFIEGALP